MIEEKQSGWLRLGEIIAGIIILVLGGYVIAFPGTAAATLIALLAIALIILAIIEFVRIFSEGGLGMAPIATPDSVDNRIPDRNRDTCLPSVGRRLNARLVRSHRDDYY